MNTLTSSSVKRAEKFDWQKTCFISEFSEETRKESCLMGWIHDLGNNPPPGERKESLHLILRDSTGLAEFEITDERWIAELAALERESVIAIKVLGKEVHDLRVLSRAKRAPILPCAITNYSAIDLVVNRPYALRSERMKAILKIQDRIFSLVRGLFEQEKFYELRPPIIAPATDPGIRGAKAAELDFYGATYKLTTSMILYKQMAICALEKVYAFSPNVRLEQPVAQKTGRHLAEFCQIDVEWAFANYNDAMNLGERLIITILEGIKKSCQKELGLLQRELVVPSRPFQRMTHREALEKLSEMGFNGLKEDQEIPWGAEKALSEKFEGPFWITDYPYGSRGFYDRQDPENPGYLRDFDLMYPGGFGEAISGSEREFLFENVKRKMLEQGLSLKEYDWYLEMLQRGVPPSAGFGLGLERLTRYICGLEKIWEAAAFPKIPGILSP